MCAAVFAADSVADISASLLAGTGNGAFITNCLVHNTANIVTTAEKARRNAQASTHRPRSGPWPRTYELEGVKTADAILRWWNRLFRVV